MRWALVISVVTALLALAGCASPPPAQPTALVVTPDQGPPGTFVTITGLTTDDVATNGIAVRVGGAQTPALVREDGSVVTALPVLFGANGWHEPFGPLDVEVVRTGATGTVVLGLAASAVRITALDPAPDAAARMEAAWTGILDGLEALASEFPSESDEERQHLVAQLEAVRELLLTGENAVPKILEGSAPLLGELPGDPRTELAAALLASSGILAESEALADRLTGADPLRSHHDIDPGGAFFQNELAPQATLLCPYTDPDQDLACKMQLYAVVKEFGQTAVAPTAKAWGEVTAFTGIAGIAMDIPAAAAIGFALTVADIVINRLVVALLPAKIDDFTLSFDDGPIVKQSDLATGRAELTASNDPPNLTSNDLLALAMSIFDVAGGAPILKDKEGELIAFAKKTFEYFLGIYANTFAAYADAHPELNLSVTLTALPHKSWGPTRIEDYRLFEAHSFTPDLLEVYDATPANPMWQASDTSAGDARVNVRTAGNEGTLIQWSGYSGGAFGEQVAATETETVCVDGPPELQAVDSVSPTVIQAETNAQVSFTLPWSDHCDNLERLYATFDLDGHDPFSLQYDVVSSPQVAGFAGTEGEGALVETMWIWCSEQGKNQVNATFYLLDEFSQTSEERTAFVLVDYGGCP